MKINGSATLDVLSETILDKFTVELVLKDPTTGSIGTYRINEGYEVIVGRNSYGVDQLDIFGYTEDPNGYIVNQTTQTIDVYSLEPELDPNGYVMMKIPAKGWPDRAHRIVAFSYCKKAYVPGNVNIKFDVDHINGNKEDNRPENLEYTIPLINQYRAALNKYNGSQDRFITELKRVFDEESKEYITFAMEQLKKELE